MLGERGAAPPPFLPVPRGSNAGDQPAGAVRRRMEGVLVATEVAIVRRVPPIPRMPPASLTVPPASGSVPSASRLARVHPGLVQLERRDGLGVAGHRGCRRGGQPGPHLPLSPTPWGTLVTTPAPSETRAVPDCNPSNPLRQTENCTILHHT